jgi:hypothetical protein
MHSGSSGGVPIRIKDSQNTHVISFNMHLDKTELADSRIPLDGR